MFEHRRFYRHPTEIPIEVWDVKESDLHIQHLHDVSLGGLAFESETDWPKGSCIGVRLLLNPPVELFGQVVWCRKTTEKFNIGVEFLGKNQNTKENMVDEVCEIERYKNVLMRMAEEISDSEINMLED